MTIRNLFSALHKYYQREDHTPQENQITEMLAQLLKHEPGFTKHLLSKWFPKVQPLIAPVPETQLSVRNAKDGKSTCKFIDLAVFDNVEDCRMLALVVEVKWWSGENWSVNERGMLVPQTESYDSYIERCESKYVPVGKLYLTRRIEASHKDWVAKRWADLYDEAVAYRRARLENAQSFGLRLLSEFIDFLEDENVEELPLNITDVAQIEHTIKVCKKLDTIFKQIQHKMNECFGTAVAAKSFGNQLLEQMVNQDRVALYWYAYASVHIICGIYTSAEQFEEKEGLIIPVVRGVPVLSTTVVATPGSREHKQCIGSDTMARLRDHPGWWVAEESANSWVLAHRTTTFLELWAADKSNTQDFTSAAVEFFVKGLADLKSSGLIDSLNRFRAAGN